jgi:hypothetical protein
MLPPRPVPRVPDSDEEEEEEDEDEDNPFADRNAVAVSSRGE